MPNSQPTTESARRHWLKKLIEEFYQTERSAVEHPRKEADRLGNIPPAHAMLAVATHAEQTLAQAHALFSQLDLPEGNVGEGVGKGFSLMRDLVADRLLTMERSYRGTVLGMTHGLDLTTLLIELLERTEPHHELVEFLQRWHHDRAALVETCRHQLSWFVNHPEVADMAATDGLVARGLRVIFQGVGRLGDTPQPSLPQ